MTTGKWSLPDVPKVGWACVDIDDAGRPRRRDERVRPDFRPVVEGG